MSRPQKETVDYFPHEAIANDGTTLTILQSKFGNDGYAFWFKLLERLCSTKGHFIDCRNPARWQFLLAKTQVTEQIGTQILNLLAELDAIDKDLWCDKLIWSQNLVNNVAAVYKNRRTSIPQKPNSNNQQPSIASVSTTDNPQRTLLPTTNNRQSKVKYSKVNNNSNKKNKTGIIFKQFEDNFQRITEATRQVLGDYIDSYGADNVLIAMNKAIKQNKRSLAYVEGILEERGHGKNKRSSKRVEANEPYDGEVIPQEEWERLTSP